LNLVQFIEKATPYLEKHGVNSPRLNAEVLLGHVLGISRVEIYTHYDRTLTQSEAELFRIYLVRRARGYPLQYRTGEAGFRGLAFEVRPGVFIPRPETEVLVEKVLEGMPSGHGEVLDIGTGCGNIAVSVAVAHTGAVVAATDRDWLALELCARNARRHGVEERVETFQGDLYDALDAAAGRTFDVIVSNPPYVPAGSWEELPVEVREYEPVEALLGGEDGLDVMRDIVSGALAHMKDGGWLFLEVDERQMEDVTGSVLSGWNDVGFFEDLAGRPRVVRARMPG